MSQTHEADFDQKKDNKARSVTRKGVTLMMELRKSNVGSKPVLCGLPSNSAFKGDFEVVEDQIDMIIIEFLGKLETLEIEGITELLNTNSAEFIDAKEHEYDGGSIVSRVLIDVKKIPS